MIPGFEAGLRSMRVGGRRRVIVPPELGPPVRLVS
jgi:FKBP-type peptidyl-prolyl cis-trans isomerase